MLAAIIIESLLPLKNTQLVWTQFDVNQTPAPPQAAPNLF